MKTSTHGLWALSARRRAEAFTLVELLAVIALIMLLLGFTLGSIGPQGGFSLNRGGNLVADLVQQARQNAMAKGKMTLLAIIDDEGLGERNHRRLFIMMEKGHGDTEWQPVGKWERLPEGIIATEPPGSVASFFTQSPNIVTGDFPNLEGKPVDAESCKVQVFLPNGGLSTRGVADPDSPVIRLLEQKEMAQSEPRNYYDVKLNRHTGTPAIGRP